MESADPEFNRLAAGTGDGYYFLSRLRPY